jgi:hypothetical protein
VVDNGSGSEAKRVLERAVERGYVDNVIFLRDNEGGCALNRGIVLAHGEFVHISENDVEYRSGWDSELLSKFDAFPTLGQISPFGPFPEVAEGEVWVNHPGKQVVSQGKSIWITNAGVGTTSVVRRAVVDAGIRWANIEGQGFRWPNDALFSRQVHELGYEVAWNDRYVATNWGHNVLEWNTDIDYYLGSYAAKSWVGVEGLETRLASAGYLLVRTADGTVTGIGRFDARSPSGGTCAPPGLSGRSR